jgi:hypothetical protein
MSKFNQQLTINQINKMNYMTDIITEVPSSAAEGETVESLNLKREAARKAMRRARQAEVKAEGSGYARAEELAMQKAEESSDRLWEAFNDAMTINARFRQHPGEFSSDYREEEMSIEERQEVAHYEG